MDAPALRVYFDGTQYLMWNARHVYILRCAHRILGELVGALPTNKRQCAEMGLPLRLVYEEVLLGAEEGFIEVVDVSLFAPNEASDNPDPSPAAIRFFTAEAACWAEQAIAALPPDKLRHRASTDAQWRALVYRELWQRGLWVASGSFFGVDWCGYLGDPLRHHAHMMVLVAPAGCELRSNDVSALTRVARTAKKVAYLATQAPAGGVQLDAVQPCDELEARLSSRTFADMLWAAVESNTPSGGSSADSTEVASTRSELEALVPSRRFILQRSHDLVDQWLV